MKARWLALMMLIGSQRSYAHPIHTTLTKVSVDKGAITLNIRAFADDFSLIVARFAGKPAPADSSALPGDILLYARAFFTVASDAGAPVVLESCGVRRAAELYWLCLRAPLPGGSRGARLRNQMLTDLHADQVNIVQLEPPAPRRTMLFTKGSAAAVIAYERAAR